MLYSEPHTWGSHRIESVIMNDPLQQAMQSFALQNGMTRAIAVFCAQMLIFVLAIVWLGVCALRANTISIAVIARMVVLVALSMAAAKVLANVVVDTRPYLVEHTQPLAPVSADNGFPSDHTLLAAALTASLWWIDRRAVVFLALGTLLLMLGRLGIEAHHTLDVAGSVAIVVVAAIVASMLPLPAAWRKPLFARASAMPVESQVPVRSTPPNEK